MSACTNWIALSDREALGEVLGDEERRYLRAHAHECVACGAERDVWRSLQGLDVNANVNAANLGADLNADADETALPAPRATPATPLRARWRTAWMLLAAAMTVALAIGARHAWKRTQGSSSETRTAERAPASDPMRLNFLSGDVDVDGRALVAGATLPAQAIVSTRAGTACLVVGEGIGACLAPATRVRIVSAGGPDRRLAVLSGVVVAELAPQPPGSSFTMEAPDGTATAIGTAFSVEVPADGSPSITHVLHGTVLVRPRSAPEKRVTAHTRTAMVDGPPTPLDVADETRDLRVLVPALNTGGASDARPAIARFDSDPPGATVTIDDRAAQHTPLSILLEPGEHSVTVEGATGRVRDVVRLAPGERLDRHFDLGAAHVSSPPPRAPPSSARAESAPSLLHEAREKSAHGDAPGAAAAYRALLDRYPSSAEAAAGEIAFGELELGPLGDANGSLRTFDRYLAHGGPLRQEASYGRIRALRALGRSDEERAAIDAFLGAYPDGPLASALRIRARALEAPR